MPHISHQECFKCKKIFNKHEILFWCPDCKGPILVKYKKGVQKQHLRKKEFKKQEVSHWKYWMFYPISRRNVISMGEGGTPLIKDLRHKNLLLKYEGTNPTGSFKDRGSTIEISHAMQIGITSTVCASTGNMGASVAAYCSRAGIRAAIYVPRGATYSKLKQIKSHGAKVVKVMGDYTVALRKTQKLWLKKKVYQTGDYVYRQEGQKSTVFEILDQLKFQAPRNIIIPIGMGTHFFAAFKALEEMREVGLIQRMPRLVAVQSSHCSTVAKAYQRNMKQIPEVKNPKTIASAIACGKPNYGELALHALRKSNGIATTVTDDDLRRAKDNLAEQGIYAESSGAATYAAAKKLKLRGKTVAVITGHGLKDTLVE